MGASNFYMYRVTPYVKPFSALAILLSSLVVFTACSSAPSIGNNSSVNAANTNAEKTPAPTPAAGSGEMQLAPPEDTVAALYKAHDAKRSPFFQTKDRALVDKYFTKQLGDLIWKDATSSAGEVGAIDFDPLYNTQDPEIKNFAVGKGDVRDNAATVAATFTNFDQKQTVTFLLKAVGDAWKIDNIDYGGGTTLQKLLKEYYSKATPTANSGKFEGKFSVGTTSCTVKKVNDSYEVRWEKGSGAEVYEPAVDLTFEATDDKGQNRFVFDNANFDSGVFVRSDGKTFSVKRVK